MQPLDASNEGRSYLVWVVVLHGFQACALVLEFFQIRWYYCVDDVSGAHLRRPSPDDVHRCTVCYDRNCDGVKILIEM